MAVIAQWLRLLPIIEWIPHPLPTYERHLITFISCGWAHGTFIMPPPLHVLTQMWEVAWNPASLLGYKGYHRAVVEALTQPNMEGFPNPLPTYERCWSIYMLWMGTWIHYHEITTTCINPDFVWHLEVFKAICLVISNVLSKVSFCSWFNNI